jgi:hypothetical protein
MTSRALTKTGLMKLLRRTHLYFGLFMAPWILLYGVSGFMFNHPDWFAFGAQETVKANIDLSSIRVPPVPRAEDMAQEVVSVLNDSDRDHLSSAIHHDAG